MAVSNEQRRSDIRELQSYLRTISRVNPKIPMVFPNGIFDDSTKAAVTAFQAEYGLPVTGGADTDTWNAVYRAYKDALVFLESPEAIIPTAAIMPEKSIVIGNAGYAVYIIQAMLNTILQFYDNIENAPVNGIYDGRTAASVMDVQRVNGQEPTGVMDINTWNSLARLYNYHAMMDDIDNFPQEENAVSCAENSDSEECVG
ncbi:MAG: peptidoglycan-binding protein [Oscillospiraceae bacterium]|nr:peptidoglycan-binding protein [Oscillospiraceae bacterium]